MPFLSKTPQQFSLAPPALTLNTPKFVGKFENSQKTSKLGLLCTKMTLVLALMQLENVVIVRCPGSVAACFTR